MFKIIFFLVFHSEVTFYILLYSGPPQNISFSLETSKEYNTPKTGTTAKASTYNLN